MAHLEAAFTLIESCQEASLGTLEEKGPFVSLVGYLYEKEISKETPFGSLYVLISDLARHTRNLKKQNQVSLLITQKTEETPAHEKQRATLQGTASVVTDKDKIASLKERYVVVFPRSEVFFTLADFHFYEIAPNEIHLIEGFGQAGTFK